MFIKLFKSVTVVRVMVIHRITKANMRAAADLTFTHMIMVQSETDTRMIMFIEMDFIIAV